MAKEYIQYEGDDHDAWLCICGNMPFTGGFFPVDNGNREVQGTPEDWTTHHYFCSECGRVIDMYSLEVVRRLDPDTIVRRI